MNSGSGTQRKRKAKVARDILGYFISNPESADTLEGIVRWRLPNQAMQYGIEETQDALTSLVSQGMLREIGSVATVQMYELNRERLAEARSFVESVEEKSE